jgi:hypothetical protein
MGNGKWDDKDVSIFQGVGKWLSVNGEAIYGNEKTDLPLQVWGVTTRKNGILYLHVFNYPENGKLIVGGLTSGIAQAWFISDENKKPLKNKRLNDKDMVIYLPEIAPDTMNTVIAVKLQNVKSAYQVRLLDTNSGNTLYAFDATLHGKGFRYGDGKVNRNYVAGWKTEDQYLGWSFRTNDDAEFSVYIDYNTTLDDENGEVSILIGDDVFDVKYTAKPEKDGYNTLYAGSMKLRPGEYSCMLKGKSYTGNEYMRPIAIRFIPVK